MFWATTRDLRCSLSGDSLSTSSLQPLKPTSCTNVYRPNWVHKNWAIFSTWSIHRWTRSMSNLMSLVADMSGTSETVVYQRNAAGWGGGAPPHCFPTRLSGTSLPSLAVSWANSVRLLHRRHFPITTTSVSLTARSKIVRDGSRDCE